jgi:sigma-B regulation protein RsbU (phosphoserine phosphatase)
MKRLPPEESRFQRHHFVLGIDCVLFFTDGLIEAERNEGQIFGVDRLIDRVRRNATSPESLLESIENDARFFSGRSTFDDDICLLAVRWMAK